jgi:hypothetical protein
MSFWRGFLKQANMQVGLPKIESKLNNFRNSNLLKPKAPTPKAPKTPAGKSLGGKHGVSSMRI